VSGIILLVALAWVGLILALDYVVGRITADVNEEFEK
jgi:hypothetical protein